MLKNYTFFFLIFWTMIGFAQKPEVTATEIPTWVQTSTPDYNAAVAKEASGFYYLLVDNQDHLATQEHFRRRVYKLLNTEGLGEMADFSVNLDAAYSKLKIHFVNIIRDGETIGKLNIKDLQVFREESNAENNLYDGSYTALLNLSDIRVNDIIDYAFTIQGDNPIYEGNYRTDFQLQYTLPVHQFSYRINVPKDQKIYIKKSNNAPNPEFIEHENAKQYSWQVKDPEVIQYETNTPIWYNPAAFVEVTQYPNWAAVNEQFKKHFQLSNDERYSLKKAFIEHTHIQNSDSLVVQEIIRFVQDDIRYLGLENGLNSHLPTKPIKVLERKYGDCKDKSFLLSELLKAYGYSANPILVNSQNSKEINDCLPSPDIFDHCVVEYRNKEDQLLYVDPTINNQGGSPEAIYFPDYSYGLVLTENSNALTKLPKSHQSSTIITETFNVNNIGGNAYLEVESVYTGMAADYKRQEFSSANLESIQKRYTDFYSLLYKTIKPEITLKYSDYRERNTFKTHEFYKIDSLWFPDTDENKNKLYAEFFPMVLKNAIEPTTTAARKMPYALNANTKIDYNIVVNMPQPWNIKDESLSFSGNSFNYDLNVNYDRTTLALNYHYEVLKDFVSAKNYSSFLSKHKKITNNLPYYLTYSSNGVLNSTKDAAVPPISWLPILITLLTLIGAAIGCNAIYRKYELSCTIDKRWHKPIGGWLILILIGLIITPFKVLYQTLLSNNFYNPNTWSFLFNEETGNFYGGILIVFELVFNWTLFIYSILLVILFFQRRTILPRLVIIYLAVNFIFKGLDTFLAIQIFDKNYSNYEMQQLYVGLFMSFISIAIWIPYFIFSERVKDTFVKTKKSQYEVLNQLEEEPVSTPASF